MPRTLLFFLSCFVAFVCGHTFNYSVIIYAQDVIGSDLLSGIGFGLCFGPPIILGWYAGVLCDRMAPGRIVVMSQVAFVLASLLLLIGDQMVATASGRITLLIVAAFVAGCGWSFIAPGRFAALAQVVPAKSLHGATIILNLLIMVGFGVAPLVIALLRTTIGWPGVFWFIAIGFTLASVVLYWVPTHGNPKSHKHAIVEVGEGIKAVVAQPVLLQLLITAMMVYAAMGPMQVLLPKLASGQLSLIGLDRGIYLGMLALGLILGGVLSMALRARLHDGKTILLGCLLTGVGIIGLSQVGTPVMSAFVLLASGIIGGMVVSLIVAGLQTQTSPGVRGRVLSMYTITAQVVPAATGVMAGALSQYLGEVRGLLICGLAIALAAAIALGRLKFVRAYRHVVEQT